MAGRVGTNQSENGSDNPHEAGKAKIVPTGVVFEMGQDFFCFTPGSHDPEDNDDSKEADHVENHKEAFNHRELPDEESVDHNGENRYCYGEEASLPSLD